MRRAASTPLSSGIPISRMITSGLNFTALSTASRPSPASAHTCQPLRDSSKVRSPARTTAWSSAIRSRRFVMDFLQGWSGQADARTHGCAVGIRFDVQIPAELCHALAHAGNSDAEARGVASEFSVPRSAHAAAVISNLQDRRIHVFLKRYLREFAAGMPLDIQQAFLRNAEEGRFDDLRQPPET